MTIASGGTESTSDVYKYHKFTSDGDFVVATGGDVEVLVVAGGGAGGTWVGGGGGAGGVLHEASHAVTAQTYSITVGAGGTQPTANGKGANGADSVFDSLTAVGGGGGDAYGNESSLDGGSAGGTCYNQSNSHTGTAGPPRQGYDGGESNSSSYSGGGGGGGEAGNTDTNGYGGDGTSAYSVLLIGADAGVDIGGTRYIAGGGGGFSYGDNGSIFPGGDGGGGAGGSCQDVGGDLSGVSGTANTGGGGGGGHYASYNLYGGGGGSGIVIIRYPIVAVEIVPPAHIALTGNAPAYNIYGIPPAILDLAGQTLSGALAITMPSANLFLAGMSPRFGPAEPYEVEEASLLLLARGPSYIWNVPLAHRGNQQTIYRCYLTGSTDGIEDIELPISSWQARLRDGEPSYLSCVIPDAASYEAEITVRANGDLVLRKGVRLGNGAEQMETIASVDYESIRVDRGPKSESITISGHRTMASSSPKEWAVSGVSYYCLQADGKRRIRASMDTFLRCGDTCIYGNGINDYFVVGAITCWAQAEPFGMFMEATEA